MMVNLFAMSLITKTNPSFIPLAHILAKKWQSKCGGSSRFLAIRFSLINFKNFSIKF